MLVLAGYWGDKLHRRILVSMCGMVLALAGMIMIVALPLSHNSGRLAGYYLTNCASAGFVGLLSLISSNVAGYTKKTTVAALYLIGYCVGNIIGKSYSSRILLVFFEEPASHFFKPFRSS